jgi:hypothetical protein
LQVAIQRPIQGNNNIYNATTLLGINDASNTIKTK